MSQINTSKRINKNEPESSGYPDLVWHEEKVFIAVKTYPHPSISYKEIVCTAGITEFGKWIRLYPIDFRYMDFNNWFTKYQWIKVRIEKNQKDFRRDSYRPDVNSIQTTGNRIDTKKGWQKRKEIVLPTVTYNSLEEIQSDYKTRAISLGIFKPRKVTDLIIEADSKDWSNKHQKVLQQLTLFDKQPKFLEKIPYKFSYRFYCNDKRCKMDIN